MYSSSCKFNSLKRYSTSICNHDTTVISCHLPSCHFRAPWNCAKYQMVHLIHCVSLNDDFNELNICYLRQAKKNRLVLTSFRYFQMLLLLYSLACNWMMTPSEWLRRTIFLCFHKRNWSILQKIVVSIEHYSTLCAPLCENIFWTLRRYLTFGGSYLAKELLSFCFAHRLIT